MQSALIVHSKHTKSYADRFSGGYKDVRLLEVVRPPKPDVLRIKSDKDVVVGIGGGSVIDTAKIIARNKRCIAMPTTAAGAAMTPFATVWGKKKMSIETKRPMLRMDCGMLIKLPHSVRQSTTFDALSHAVESFWSRNATVRSSKYSRRAIDLINEYLSSKSIDTLISAGNLAGQAIAITKTNVVHAASYPVTIEYGINHGAACGMLLPRFIEYMDYGGLPKLFGFGSTKELVLFLESRYRSPKIEGFNVKLVTKRALEYEKINQGPKELNAENLRRILGNIGDSNGISRTV